MDEGANILYMLALLVNRCDYGLAPVPGLRFAASLDELPGRRRFAFISFGSCCIIDTHPYHWRPSVSRRGSNYVEQSAAGNDVVRNLVKSKLKTYPVSLSFP